MTSKANYSNPKAGDPCHPLTAGGHVPAMAISIPDVSPPLMSGSTNKAAHGARSGMCKDGVLIPEAVIAFQERMSGTQAAATQNLSPALQSCNPTAIEQTTHALTSRYDSSEDGCGRGTPLVHEVCGTLSDGAHNGGGLNGQDAYTGRIIPSTQCGGDGQEGLGDGNIYPHEPGRFL